MSQQNLEVVKLAISNINERDVDTYLSVCHSDIELITPVAVIEGPNKGEQGVRGFFEAISEATRTFELQIERLQPLEGDRVLAWLTLHLETQGGTCRDSRLRTSTNSKTADSRVSGSSGMTPRPSKPPGCRSS